MARPEVGLGLKDTEFQSVGAELLVDLAQKVAYALVSRAGVDAETAERIGIEVADLTAEDWGGQVLYIPKGSAYKLSKLHLQIYEEFDGTNHAALASKYDYTVPAIYRIIKRIKRQEMARRQFDMFPSD